MMQGNGPARQPSGLSPGAAAWDHRDVRRHIVEGEPGIFPSPVARVLQGIGGLFRRKDDDVDPDPDPDPAAPAAAAPADDDDPPPEPRAAP